MLQALIDRIATIVLGKRRQIKLAVACLLARGHLLIEDVPGTGKTTLAHALAYLLGLTYQRVQFTSDLMPADILGAVVLDPETGRWLLRRGPIFHQVVVADEINRAPPKTQSALLEAMEERQVSLENETYPLPEPFFVIATQNPLHQTGTFPLPESQLDRFLMRITLGYPDEEAERKLLRSGDRRPVLAQLKPQLSPEALLEWQQAVDRIYVSEPLLDYLQALLIYSRSAPEYPLGLSPRAGLALLQAAKAWAFLEGREAVYPEDVRAVLPAVAAHRLLPDAPLHEKERVVEPLLENVPIP